MTTQQELDLQARLADMERQIAELAAKVNPLYSGGFDRYIHSGYIQWDGIKMRFDNNGQQIQTEGNNEVIALWFVPKLSTSPSGQTPQGYIAGTTDADTVTLKLLAKDGFGNLAQAYAYADDASDSSGFRSDVDNDDISTATWVTHKTVNGQTWGVLELLNTTLRLASFTSDPTGVVDGDVWYRSDTDKLYARINGATVELGAGGGSMPMPPIVSTMSWHCIGTQLAANAVTAAASSAWPTANTAIYIPLLVTEDITVKKLWWYNGATASGNVNMALYTAAFAQVSGTETGSTAQTGTSVIQEVDIADTALTAGMYYIAIVMDNTTGTMFRHTANAQVAKALGIASEASVFDLPATATLADPIVSAAGYVPICGIATRTQVA